MKYSLETLREVWNDEAADEHVEIGPDRDALGLVELRLKSSKDIIIERMSFPPAMAQLVAQAMTACACELTTKA